MGATPLTFATICCVGLNGVRLTTYCAIFAASRALRAPFTSPNLVGVIVYAPGPKPLSEYVPSESVVPNTGGAPPALSVTLGTFLGAGGVRMLPYVMVPVRVPEITSTLPLLRNPHGGPSLYWNDDKATRLVAPGNPTTLKFKLTSAPLPTS